MAEPFVVWYVDGERVAVALRVYAVLAQLAVDDGVVLGRVHVCVARSRDAQRGG